MPSNAGSALRFQALIATAALLAISVELAAQSPALSPSKRARAERLLEQRLPCLGCHSLDGQGGRIGPDLTSVHRRLDRDEILARIEDPSGAMPGGLMPRVAMPSAWRRLVSDYLALPRHTPRPPSPRSAGASSDPPLPAFSDPSSALYARHCASCHGTHGLGDGWNAAHLPVRPTAHADSALLSRRSDDALFDIIHAGGYVYGLSPLMPPFASLLDDDQIRGLVAHIRTLCQCVGPSWSRDGSLLLAREAH